MPKEEHSATTADQDSDFVSIEKAILLDVCLGVPLGRIWLRMPAWQVDEPLPAGPKTTLLRGEQLGLLKKMYLRGDREIVEAMAALTRMADAALKRGPFSVTHKTGIPQSGDLHDYYSLAKYWWPNGASEDGRPYVLRDGHVNPDCYGERYDFVELEAFSETVLLLSLVGYLTGKVEYGRHASRLLDTWFVDEGTRQNPSFECAQAVPGKRAGGWQGIVEARRFIYVAEAVHLLEASDFLAPDLSIALRNWYAAFLDWLTNSAHGKEAAARSNNIAFWHDLQRMVYAEFCGQDELAVEIATQVTIPRLDEQLQEDGSLPAEVSRAQPHDYVAFTLMAMAMISAVGEKHGLGLWDPKGADGRNFRVAHDWLLRTTRTHELVDQLWPKPGGYEGSEEIARASSLSVSDLVDLGLQLRGAKRIADFRSEELTRTRVDLEQTRSRNAELQSQLARTVETFESDASPDAGRHEDIRNPSGNGSNWSDEHSGDPA